MSDVPLPDHWQASDGRWYPNPAPAEASSNVPAAPTPAPSQAAPPPAPAAAPAALGYSPAPSSSASGTGPSAAGGFIAFIGWVLMGIGAITAIALMVELQDQSEFRDVKFVEYMSSMSSGFMVMGVGLTAAAAGSILARMPGR